ncbi:MAG: cytochrome P450, partial [Bdellovibrionota bacterium]
METVTQTTAPLPQPEFPVGPRGIPIFGDSLRYSRDPFGYFQTIREEFGDIVSYENLGRRFFYLFQPEMAEQVLVKNYRNYIKDLFLRSWHHIFGQGLLTAEGDVWKRERRMVQPAFHKDRMDFYGRVMVDSATRTFSSWKAGEVHAINRDMMAVTLDIVVKTLFGAEIAPDRIKRVGAAFDKCTHYFEFTSGPIGYLIRKWPTPQKLRYTSGVRELDEIVLGLLEERKAKKDQGDDLLSMLLSIQDEDGSTLNNQQLRDELMTLFLAGHETTALALTYSVFLLAMNPECLKKVHAELDQVLGSRPIEPKDLPELK